MRGGALPPALLMAALAVALSFAPRRQALIAIALCLGLSALLCTVSVPSAWTEAIFLGGWLSIVLTAALVHWPQGIGGRLALVAGVNAGVWSGLLIGLAGRPLDLVFAAPGLLIILPGAWMVSQGKAIILKVAASWLMTIAVLAAVLPLIPTPGYTPDHMN